MAKRGALSEMNHDNWDQEDETEEAGVFRQASSDVIKHRQIKKAKRRGLTGQADDTGGDGAPGATAFKGFSGFVSSNTKPTFSFNKDTAKPLGGLANGGMAPFSLSGGATFGAAKPTFGTNSEAATEKKTDSVINGNTSTSKSRYLQQLRALNESVAKWIAAHVNKNAHCVLTPIFHDYEKHLAEVEKLNPDKTSTGSSKGSAPAEEPGKSSPSKSPPAKSAEAPVTTPSFSFSTGASTGLKFPATTEAAKSSPFGASAALTSSTSSSLFGSTSLPAAPLASGFSFKPSSTSGDAKPFSFATAAAAATSGATQTKTAEDEDYEPPKVEVKEIEEEGSFYTKKCKLYYQKSGAWTERGVGFIHLKPCDEKTQFLIRADTNLGNILLNIMLSSSIPFARQGKNNVSMTCMANPPVDPKETDPKPTSFLIRVKTGEEADELLEKLKHHQK